MPFDTVFDAITMAADYTDCIAIGGGEPTMHPRFFDILKKCSYQFDSVWMATNGKNTKIMERLANILNEEDYCECEDDYCMCEPIIFNDNFSVALSQDPWHEPIDPKIVKMWERNDWEIRDVSDTLDGPSGVGRAKVNNIGYSTGCICSSMIIKPTGNIHACGCHRSPIVGHVRMGMNDLHDRLQDSEKYQETRCYFGR